ncbi:transposase [Okeania sp. KiyG1]|uniref:transposase n=1 Tax=Okeania sp. KiyG1 TaxID=2720165 RepID=UPI00192367CB
MVRRPLLSEPLRIAPSLDRFFSMNGEALYLNFSVTITKTPTRNYYASLLFDTEQQTPEVLLTGKIIGIDLGLKDFCITHDGSKTAKYTNPKRLKKHQKNLARKQANLARKKKGSKSR